jgi:hypothetical protein
MAAGVIDTRSFIVVIEQDGSNPCFDALGQFNGFKQVDGLHCACCSSPGGGIGGEYSSLTAAKVDKKAMHQSTSTAGDDEEVGCMRRMQQINEGGGPGGRVAVVQGEAEAEI